MIRAASPRSAKFSQSAAGAHQFSSLARGSIPDRNRVAALDEIHCQRFTLQTDTSKADGVGA